MVCSALLCENCQMIVGSMEGDLAPRSGRLAGGYGSFGPVYHGACTWDCFDRWAWSFISREHAPKRFGPGYVLGGIRLHPAAAQRAVAMAEDHRRRQGLAHAQHLIELCGTRPDFYYQDYQVAIYIDGHYHDYAERRRRDEEYTDCLEDLGYTVIRFAQDENWGEKIARYPHIFGRI